MKSLITLEKSLKSLKEDYDLAKKSYRKNKSGFNYSKVITISNSIVSLQKIIDSITEIQ